nr:hypothetical protein [Actinomycetospora chiangmaiensis]
MTDDVGPGERPADGVGVGDVEGRAVERGDLATRRRERGNDVAADEAAGPGDHDAHEGPPDDVVFLPPDDGDDASLSAWRA